MPDTLSTWRLFRRRGARAALVAIASAVAIGVVDQLAGGVVPAITARIYGLFHEPHFVVAFSNPVEPVPAVEASNIESGAALPIKRVDADAAILLGGPGNYRLRLRRERGGAAEVLPAQLAVEKDGALVRIETADDRWAPAAVLAKEERASAGTPLSTDTRWSTTPADEAQVAAVLPPLNKRILAAALREVGVNENGPPADRARIDGYWRAATSPAEYARLKAFWRPGGAGADSPSEMPWAGAFLGYVASQAGAALPTGAISLASWRG